MIRILTVLLSLWATAPFAAPWDLVQDETDIEVDVGYLGSTVTMHFEEVLASIDFDANRPESARANIVVPVAQVETGLGVVNNLVKSKDYLNAREFPDIRFSIKRLVQTSDRTADVFGDMTLLGVTNPMLFKAKLFRYGESKTVPGKFEAGFDLAGQVDRRHFGSDTGIPQVSAVLPIRIHLLMRER